MLQSSQPKSLYCGIERSNCSRKSIALKMSSFIFISLYMYVISPYTYHQTKYFWPYVINQQRGNFIKAYVLLAFGGRSYLMSGLVAVGGYLGKYWFPLPSVFVATSDAGGKLVGKYFGFYLPCDHVLFVACVVSVIPTMV